MVLNDEFTGILSLSHEQPGFYTSEHARLAAAIATQAAIAIENARLYQQAQQVAALEERQRLARELHDSVSQSLFSMAMISGALPRLLERDAAQAIERSERLHELALGALAEMRALIFELHPDSLEREGLVGALARLAAAMQARHGLSTSTTLDDGVEAPIEVQEALYRIGQEAIHNTVKHAHASRLAVRLSPEGGSVVLEVQDDGIGFDPSGPFPGPSAPASPFQPVSHARSPRPNRAQVRCRPAGEYHAARPKSFKTAGTRNVRTIVASINTAMNIPTVSDLTSALEAVP
jgi:signal transduction histidine kinase